MVLTKTTITLILEKVLEQYILTSWNALALNTDWLTVIVSLVYGITLKIGELDVSMVHSNYPVYIMPLLEFAYNSLSKISVSDFPQNHIKNLHSSSKYSKKTR